MPGYRRQQVAKFVGVPQVACAYFASFLFRHAKMMRSRVSSCHLYLSSALTRINTITDRPPAEPYLTTEVATDLDLLIAVLNNESSRFKFHL